MPRYIEHTVEKVRDDPEEGASIELLIGLDTASVDQIRSQIDSIGGEIIETLPFDTIKIRVPQDTVEAVCSLEGIKSVETDAELEDLNEGNGPIPPV